MPEGETPAAARPSLLSRLSSWRAPAEPQTMEVHAPEGSLGLQFERDSTVLSRIKDTSPLLNKVQVGWTLVSVDGEDVSRMNGWQVTKLLTSRVHDPDGRRLSFTTGETRPVAAGEVLPEFEAEGEQAIVLAVSEEEVPSDDVVEVSAAGTAECNGRYAAFGEYDGCIVYKHTEREIYIRTGSAGTYWTFSSMPGYDRGNDRSYYYIQCNPKSIELPTGDWDTRQNPHACNNGTHRGFKPMPTLSRGARKKPFDPTIRRLTLVRPEHALRFDHAATLRAGGIAPLTAGDLNVGLLFPEPRLGKSKKVDKINVGVGNAVKPIDVRLDGPYVVWGSAKHGELLLHVRKWKLREGEPLQLIKAREHWKLGPTRNSSGVAGRDFVLQADGTIALRTAPHLRIGGIYERLNPPESARLYSSVYWSICDCCTGTFFNQSMLDSSTGWAPTSVSPGEWIQIDLAKGSGVYCWSVAGIIVQGRNSRSSYPSERVTQLSVSYKRSLNSQWEKARPFLMDVVGSKNKDDTHHVLNFDEPVAARYIRVEPTLWNAYPTMRCGFIARPASKEQTAPQAPSEEEIER